MRVIKRKASKAILKVKAGTSNDLVYHELRRGDIISKITDRQYKFFQKVFHLQDDGAVVKTIIEICENDIMVKYYSNLHGITTMLTIWLREKQEYMHPKIH